MYGSMLCLLFFKICTSKVFDTTFFNLTDKDLKSPSAALCLKHSFSLFSSFEKEKKNTPCPPNRSLSIPK